METNTMLLWRQVETLYQQMAAYEAAGCKLIDMCLAMGDLQAAAKLCSNQASMEMLVGPLAYSMEAGIIKKDNDNFDNRSLGDKFVDFFKNIVRSMQDFFLKYSVFISRVDKQLSGLIKLYSKPNVKIMANNELTEKVGEKFEDIKILKADQLTAEVTQRLKDLTTATNEEKELTIGLSEEDQEKVDKTIGEDDVSHKTGSGSNVVDVTTLTTPEQIVTSMKAHRAAIKLIVNGRHNLMSNVKKLQNSLQSVKKSGSRSVYTTHMRNMKANMHSHLMQFFKMSSAIGKSANALMSWASAKLDIMHQTKDTRAAEESARSTSSPSSGSGGYYTTEPSWDD